MNPRSILAIAFLAAAVSTWADPLNYVVRIKGEKVGTYVDETTGDDASGYIDDSTFTLKREGKTATIHEIERYGKDGIDSSKTFEVTEDDHTVKMRATLTDDGAKVSVWDDDDKQDKDVPLATKTSRADATNFWWKSAKPDVGASVTYQTFDVEDLKWSDVTLKYIGKTKVKIGDQEFDANEVDRTEGDDSSKVYVDDKGDALVVEDGDMRIERDLRTIAESNIAPTPARNVVVKTAASA